MESTEGKNRVFREIRDYLAYFLVRVFICIIQAVRIETCERIAEVLAIFANDILRLRRDVIEENLRHVYPNWTVEQRRLLSRKMWRHLVLMICEVAHVPRKVHETNWRKYVKVSNREAMVRFLLDTRPTVIVSGHFGNFEVGSYTSGLLGFATHAIARPLDNHYLHRYLEQFRAAKVQFMIPTEGSTHLIQQVIQSGGTLSLLGDQNAGRKGCWVDFLGRPASCHKAVSVFTLSGGAPMIVMYLRRLGRPMQFELGMNGIVDPETMDDDLRGIKPLTQWYNQRLEELILEDPDQFWWLHRRWKDQPTPRGRRRKAAA